MLGIDLNPEIGPDFPGVSPETWEGASGADVVKGLYERVTLENRHLLGSNPSLHTLAHLATAPQLSERMRARLEECAPELLDRINAAYEDL